MTGLAALWVPIAVLAAFAVIGLLTLKRFVYICQPNEVFVFSGRRYRVGGQMRGYRLIKGGRGFRLPLLERVDWMDLTNMVIEVSARDAYSKGGIPLTVQGVANVKVAGHEPVLNNAIERFLGKKREEIGKIAKATLEGSLRGVLATMTPEEVNEDRLLFAERLVHEVEHDMTALGLVVDTLKIQHVHDQVKYLDSIGRKKNAEVIRRARIAEAQARSESRINAAGNREREALARIQAERAIAGADAEKRLTATLSQRDALAAEEQATVAALIAKARAGLDVQRARVEQVRHQLDADVVARARAACQAAESAARAEASPIVADGKARAAALATLAESWRHAGARAREIFLLQKLDGIVAALTDVIASTRVEELTMIDARAPALGDDAPLPMKALATVESLRQVFGAGLAERVAGALSPRQQDPTAGSPPPASAPRRRSASAPPPPLPSPEIGPLDLVEEPEPPTGSKGFGRR